jgi:glucosamine--fructose-6-phosphate aminotransferase (isomerizing)
VAAVPADDDGAGLRLGVRTTSRLAHEIAEQAPVLRSVLGSNAHALDRARAAVARSARVLLVGIGSSRHVAAYGVACLEAFGSTPVMLLPSPSASIALPALRHDDVVVVVSQSGRTPALAPLVEAARRAGAFLVSVTNAPDSPLEVAADAALLTGAGAETVVPATKSVTASMLLLRTLAAPVPDEAVEDLARAVEQAVQDTDGSGRAFPSIVVAGGFAAEAVSDEVALKLAEVCGALVVAETLVDFLHGPAAVPAPVLAFLDRSDPNAAALTQRPDVVRVEADLTGDPTLSPVVQIVIGQVLALRWAEARGLDPDHPRGLDKVTSSL